MAEKYLDINGVKTLWDAVKDYTSVAGNNKAAYMCYNESSRQIELWPSLGASQVEGATPLSTVDASPFIKDAMLREVKIVSSSTTEPITYKGTQYSDGTQFIRFTWNVDAGDADPDVSGVQAKTDYIMLSELAKTYTGSATIGIDSTQNNMLYVKEVQDEIVKVGKIALGGTPLGDYIKKNGGPSEINAGNLQDVLIALLSNDNYPTNYKVTRPSNVMSTSNGSLTLTLEHSGENVEVGESVTVSASLAAASATASYTFSGFTNGYATTLGGSKAGNNPSSISVTDVTTLNNVNTISFTLSGFNETITSVSGTHQSPAKLTGTELIVRDGTCSVTANSTSETFQAKNPEIPSYYAISSLGNTSEDEKTEYIAAATDYNFTSNSMTKSVSKQLTGARKAFWGGSNGNFTVSSANIRGLEKSQLGSKPTKIVLDAGFSQIILAYPAAWGKINKVADDNNLGAIITGDYVLQTDTVNVEGYGGYTAAAYYVYILTSGTVLDKVNHTIS